MGTELDSPPLPGHPAVVLRGAALCGHHRDHRITPRLASESSFCPLSEGALVSPGPKVLCGTQQEVGAGPGLSFRALSPTAAARSSWMVPPEVSTHPSHQQPGDHPGSGEMSQTNVVVYCFFTQWGRR